MEKRHFELLEFLFKAEISSVDIAPLMYKWFPLGKDKIAQRLVAQSTIYDMTGELQMDRKWARFNYNTIENKELNEGRIWYDEIKFYATLYESGAEAYKLEKQRRDNEKLINSQIATNNATKLGLYASLAFSSISIVLVSITVVQTCNSQTEQKLEGITIQMKEQKKSFDSINGNLEKLYKAIKTFTPDTSQLKKP